MKPALIVIDVQKGIDAAEHWGGNRNNPEAEQNIALLLNFWRANGWPVVIVQHCSTSQRSPFYPGQPGNELKPGITVQAHEKLLQKSTASAFINTDLQQHLETIGVDTVVIAGFVTNNSVEATARMAGELGFNATVVSDATATFDKVGLDGEKFPAPLVHALSLANLNGEYARIRSTQAIVTAGLI